MGPPKNKSEVEQFAELLSNPVISRYLAHRGGFTVEDEQDWYEKIRADKTSATWLLFDVTDGKRIIIGNTSLHSTREMALPVMSSGFMIARKDYWGRGIASTTHKVRTWHGFNRLGLSCIRSGVLTPNIGSRKALESVGYVVVATERNVQTDDGRFVHQHNLECVNPDTTKWRQWWHNDTIPKKFRDARIKTQSAVDWVSQELKPLE
jgi:RimJ/RimL family protein N-acetyltransferase